ncbi:MAG: PrsW family intramembrane metalloprotease [Anaerolineales bacterium]|nr:PrsW family intramembrane metalloprotease [Anaerolineales bacterium]
MISNASNLNSPSAPNSTTQIKNFSLLQGIATALIAFFILNTAIGLLLYSFFEMLTSNFGSESAFSLLLLAGGFFTTGLLLIPSTLLAFSRFFGWNTPTWMHSLHFPPLYLMIFFYPLILLGGYWLSTHAIMAYLLLPLLHILAIGTPIAVVLEISLTGLSGVSPQRKWSALSVGMTLSPFLIFIVEIIALIFPLVLFALWTSLDPERLIKLNQLAETFRQPLTNPETLLDTLKPYLADSSLVLTILIFVGLIVPLIEELIKPVGVWFLYGRTQGTLDGFVAGALCGAGYALLESFMLGSSKSDWLFAVLGRSGTGAIHIFASALVGATLTEVWRNQRYLHLVLAYLIAVFFHGIWNSFAILMALRSVSASEQGFWALPLTQELAAIAPLSMLLLAGLGISGLWLFNRQIRQGQRSNSQKLIKG